MQLERPSLAAMNLFSQQYEHPNQQIIHREQSFASNSLLLANTPYPCLDVFTTDSYMKELMFNPEIGYYMTIP
ncbi:hypothetical protein [Legionella sainthelensi]|uniref:hypothetical protein n=1 Tax=Legionella sainthelensi TaxID=28087 RepID=UPI001013D4D4|nr:hypothetical protein [Legionella sainthelensi]